MCFYLLCREGVNRNSNNEDEDDNNNNTYRELTVCQELFKHVICVNSLILTESLWGRNYCYPPFTNVATGDHKAPQQEQQSWILSPSSLVPETISGTTSLNCFSRRGSKTEQVSGMELQDRSICHDVRISLSWFHRGRMQVNWRGSSMAFPWSALGSKAGFWTQSVSTGRLQSTCYLPSIIRVSILHFIAWPAHLKTPSHAESSEWPRPNWKRWNSVGQPVTLAFN